MTRQFWANLILCIFLGSLTIFAVTRIGSALTPKGLLVSDPQPSADAAALIEQISLAKYKVGEKPGKMIEADFFINNGSETDVKNVTVLCEFYDANKEYTDRKLWILPGPFAAGKTVQQSVEDRRYINSRATALNCRIADLELDRAPFFVLHKAATEGHGAVGDDGHGPAAPAVQGH